MNSIGIDISKGKSMVAAMRPFGELVAKPYEVVHTSSELKKLAIFLKSLNGETRVIMECTGRYHECVAETLSKSGIRACLKSFQDKIYKSQVYKLKTS